MYTIIKGQNDASEKSTMSSEKGRGGRRKGAGRPKGSGKYQGEDQKMMRVPVSRMPEVRTFLDTSGYQVPVFSSSVRAGIPTNVADEYPDRVKLIDYLTDNPEETFLVRAEGDSMIDANIHEGDMLVVDGSIEAKNKDIVVASVDNDQTVKQLRVVKGKTFLYPANKEYPVIPIKENTELHVWGVVQKKIGEVG